MSTARASKETYRRGVNILEVTAERTIAINEQNIHATANTATDDYTLTLPPVFEAEGRIFTVHATIANAKTVTLADQDDSLDWNGDYTLDADNDRIALLAAGGKWWAIDNQIA